MDEEADISGIYIVAGYTQLKTKVVIGKDHVEFPISDRFLYVKKFI